jgi:hypothetical protein
MAEKTLHVTRVGGKLSNRRGDFLDEFESLELRWKQPGWVYCWLDTSQRSLPLRKQWGWQICHNQRDFLDLGCPEDRVPGTVNAAGEIVQGDVILGKMPAELYDRRVKYRREKRQHRRQGYFEAVYSEGEKVAAQARSRGYLGKNENIVFSPND